MATSPETKRMFNTVLHLYNTKGTITTKPLQSRTRKKPPQPVQSVRVRPGSVRRWTSEVTRECPLPSVVLARQNKRAKRQKCRQRKAGTESVPVCKWHYHPASKSTQTRVSF